MQKHEAIELVQDALFRIKNEPKNANQGWQCGGAYWRLSAVIKHYLLPKLEENEGKAHADRLIQTHSPQAPTRPIDFVYAIEANCHKKNGINSDLLTELIYLRDCIEKGKEPAMGHVNRAIEAASALDKPTEAA